MPDRVMKFNLTGAGSVVEKHLDRVRIAVPGVIILRVAWRLAYLNPASQRIDSRVSGEFVRVTIGGQVAIDQSDRDDILQAMIARRVVRQRTCRAYSAQCSRVGFYDYAFDVAHPASYLGMKANGALDRGLRVTLRWMRNLELHVLDDAGAERA